MQSGIIGCSDDEMAPGGDGGDAGLVVHSMVLPGPAPGMSPIISGGTEAGAPPPVVDQAAVARVDFADRSRHWSTEFNESRSKPDDDVEELEFDLLETASTPDSDGGEPSIDPLPPLVTDSGGEPAG